jgi:hypothetical protein
VLPVRARSDPASRWGRVAPVGRRDVARANVGRVAGVCWPRPWRVKATVGLDSAWGGAGRLGPPVGAQGR